MFSGYIHVAIQRESKDSAVLVEKVNVQSVISSKNLL